MGYPYEDLAEAQFEALVVQAAKLQLGKGVQAFATGIDGGRDARFEGLANGFPSHSRPWDGVSIIQAKHTFSYGYFSDADFSGDAANSVLTKEIVRAKKLHDGRMLDNYLLYSNRFLTANANEALVQQLAAGIGISTENIHLCGVESLDEAFRAEPRLAQLAGINPLDGPLIVSSRDLAEVVEAITQGINFEFASTDSRPVARTSLAKKNQLNSMTEKTSNRLMRNHGHVLRQIQSFLADPGNSRIRKMYVDCAEDFDLKIVAHKEQHHTFDAVFGRLVDILVSRDALLSRNRRLTRAIVFYMYWNCDIGDTEGGADVIPRQA